MMGKLEREGQAVVVEADKTGKIGGEASKRRASEQKDKGKVCVESV